jgi:ribosomal protein S18 acetylase RimI-like enzyme
MSGTGKFFKYLFTGRFDKIGAAFAEWVPSVLYHRAAGWIFELDRKSHDSTKLTAQLPDGYNCRFAEREELHDCSKMIGLEVEEYYRRFEFGDRCYAVYTDIKPVNLNWIHAGSCYVRGMGYDHNAENDEYYIYGIMTDPSQRGKGLYKNSLIQLAEYLFNKDGSKLIQMVEDGNTAVLHTLPKLGYKKTKRLKHITLLGIRKTTVTDLADNSKKRKLFIFPPRELFII